MVSTLMRAGMVVVFACSAQVAFGQNGNGSTTTTTETTTTETGGTQVKTLKFVEKKFEVPYLTLETETISIDHTEYHGVDDFFNVREANPNVRAGQWQLETRTAWSTYRGGRMDDDFTVSPSIKYGITDDVFAELEVLPLNFGDGSNIADREDLDYGQGETNLKVFWRFMREQDLMPAMALSAEMRLPTGCNSSKVDGTLNLHMTKHIASQLRFHMLGFIKTANGARGDFDHPSIGDRRHFQWGVGPGFDYSLDDRNLLVFNYLNRSDDYYGHQNNNLLELGWVHHLADNQQLMLAATAEVHPDETTGAHWTGKVQYSIAW